MGKKLTSIIAIVSILSLILLVDIDTISTDEKKYAIKKWHSTYINKTGTDTEEYKIKLSDNYWTSGKFGF